MPQQGVFDTESLARQARGDAREQYQEGVAVAAQAALETSKAVDERDYNNFEKQAGHQLSVSEFETRLKKLDPSFLFDTNHLSDSQAAFLHLAPGSTTRRVWRRLPSGAPEYLAAYMDQALLPERTVMLTRPKRVPVPIEDHKLMKVAGEWVKVPNISALDMPPVKQIGAEPDGKPVYEWGAGPRPGQVIAKEPCGMIVGWRTVLAQLRGRKVLTADQIEREFGVDDSHIWAVRMGRRDGTIPF